MAKKRYKVDILSPSSIERLKKELIYYRDELPAKCEKLVERLAKIGLLVANLQISESPLGGYVSLSIDMQPEVAGYKAILISTGAVMQSEGYDDFNVLLAIEFGAGIHYNKTANPNAGEFGYGVGTFPGQIHAFEDGWWYWDSEAEEWKYTHGVKAPMPMYEASKSIIKEIVRTAKEVFA